MDRRHRLSFSFSAYSWVTWFFSGALLSSTIPCSAATAQLFSQSHAAMGTAFTIYLYARDSEEAAADFEMAFAEVDRLDATFVLPQLEVERAFLR
jgi:thiamine biosynthesis lipoprotein ApbE